VLCLVTEEPTLTEVSLHLRQAGHKGTSEPVDGHLAVQCKEVERVLGWRPFNNNSYIHVRSQEMNNTIV
jgi:hypothetical protein